MDFSFRFWIIIPILVDIIVADHDPVKESTRPQFRKDYRYESALKTFYKVHKGATDWSRAKIGCEAEGTSFFVPESMDEVEVAVLLISSTYLQYRGVFIGIHDMYSNRLFTTINGAKMVGSMLDILWKIQEPLPEAGNCVGMDRNGRLFVHQCSDPLPYLCKIKYSDAAYNKDCDTFTPGWMKGPTGSCYILHREPLNWYDAYSSCLASDGYLAIINNRTEADYLRQIFKEYMPMGVPQSDLAFLGFSDLFQKHHYRTVHGQRLEEAGFSDWKSDCSYNFDNLSRNSASDVVRCGGMNRSGLLTVADCNVPAVFFCEKPSASMAAQRSRLRAVKQDTTTQLINKMNNVVTEATLMKTDEVELLNGTDNFIYQFY